MIDIPGIWILWCCRNFKRKLWNCCLCNCAVSLYLSKNIQNVDKLLKFLLQVLS